MKYNDKYPDLTSPIKRYPQAMLGPHPEVIVEPGIVQSWRAYPCAVCKLITGWRCWLGDDHPPVPSCSEECSTELRLPLLPPEAVTVEEDPPPESFDEMFLSSNLVDSDPNLDPVKNSTDPA